MPPDPEQPRRIDDPETLKALAHPLRQRLWRLLHQRGPATVGNLSGQLAADPGQVSYHLRELAKRGWVAHAPELARDRRESWWRAVMETTTWRFEDFPTPEGKAVVTHMFAQLASGDVASLRRFVRGTAGGSQEWLDAAVSSRSFLFLTAPEARAMHEELNQVLRRWAKIGRQAGEAAGRLPYFHFMYGFPEPDAQDGHVPHAFPEGTSDDRK